MKEFDFKKAALRLAHAIKRERGWTYTAHDITDSCYLFALRVIRETKKKGKK